MTNILAKLTHFGISSSIIGNRPISICGKGDSKSRKHSYCCYTYSI